MISKQMDNVPPVLATGYLLIR